MADTTELVEEIETEKKAGFCLKELVPLLMA